MSFANHMPATEKYLFSRDVFRSRAKKEFFERKPDVAPLISVINDYVASTMLGLSGKDIFKTTVAKTFRWSASISRRPAIFRI